MFVIAQFIPEYVYSLYGLSVIGVYKIVYARTFIHIYMELMNMGENRRMLLVKYEHVNMFSLIQHHSTSRTHLCTRNLMLLSCYFTKTQNIHVVSAERGSDTQWVSCYWMTVSRAPFPC